MLLLVISVIAYSIILFINVYDATKQAHLVIELEGNKSELRAENVTIGDDPISILLIGVEDYDTNGQNGRADTLIVVTLNPNTEQLTMTTIPRDTSIEFTEEEQGDMQASIRLMELNLVMVEINLLSKK